MKKKKNLPQVEVAKTRLVYRIMQEKEYTESCSRWMVNRLEALADHMQYGHAVIAYRLQTGDFRLVKGTLLYYACTFGKPYAFKDIKGGVMLYWDVEAQGWRTFQAENFLEWRAVV